MPPDCPPIREDIRRCCAEIRQGWIEAEDPADSPVLASLTLGRDCPRVVRTDHSACDCRDRPIPMPFRKSPRIAPLLRSHSDVKSSRRGLTCLGFSLDLHQVITRLAVSVPGFGITVFSLRVGIPV